MSIKTKKNEKLSRPLEAMIYNVIAAHTHFCDDEEDKAQKHVRRARALMRQLVRRGEMHSEHDKLYAVANLLQYVEDSWGIWDNRENWEIYATSLTIEEVCRGMKLPKVKGSVAVTTEPGNREVKRG